MFLCVLSPSHTAAMFWLLAHTLLHSHQGWLGFSFHSSLKEPAQPLDVNLDQRLKRVGLFWADVGLPTHLHVEGHSPTNSPSRHHGGSHCQPAVMPASRRHTSSFPLVTTLVNISAPLSSVCTFSICICLEFSTSRIQ